jgi:hypothetical protein
MGKGMAKATVKEMVKGMAKKATGIKAKEIKVLQTAPMVCYLATPTFPSLLRTAVTKRRACNSPMDIKQHGESFFVPGISLRVATSLIVSNR